MWGSRGSLWVTIGMEGATVLLVQGHREEWEVPMGQPCVTNIPPHGPTELLDWGTAVAALLDAGSAQTNRGNVQ